MLCKISKVIDLSTVYKAFKRKLNFFPYKTMAEQEMEITDHEKWFCYCGWFNQFIKENTTDLSDVTYFTDEAWFHFSGYINFQNLRLQSSDNPNSLQEIPVHES